MGQSIISAGLIIIVTIAVINANRLVINSEASKLEGLARMHAADIAMELVTEARSRRYDELSVTTSYQSTSDFTRHWRMGPGYDGESFAMPDTLPYRSLTMFDDFDDYNGYSRRVNTSTISGYLVSCRVFYASQSDPDTPYSDETYVKTLQVTVTHPLYLPNGIRISYTKTY